MFEQAFRNIDDVLWKEAGCTIELDYTEQTSWVRFLSDNQPPQSYAVIREFRIARRYCPTSKVCPIPESAHD